MKKRIVSLLLAALLFVTLLPAEALLLMALILFLKKHPLYKK